MANTMEEVLTNKIEEAERTNTDNDIAIMVAEQSITDLDIRLMSLGG